MSDKIIENNQVTIMGEVASQLHSARGIRGRLLYGGSACEAFEQFRRSYSADDFREAD